MSLYSSLSKLNIRYLLIYSDKNSIKDLPKAQYQASDMKTYRLGNITKGIHKFVPVEFTGIYTSVMNMYIQCSVTDIFLVK
jgi:hypothetical protein